MWRGRPAKSRIRSSRRRASSLRVSGTFDVSLLADPGNVERLRVELSSDLYYGQRILSTILVPDNPPSKMVKFPKIYQFLGQRYVFDSEIIQNVVYDRVPAFEHP